MYVFGQVLFEDGYRLAHVGDHVAVREYAVQFLLIQCNFWLFDLCVVFKCHSNCKSIEVSSFAKSILLFFFERNDAVVLN
jgi:hypothetical protein